MSNDTARLSGPCFLCVDEGYEPPADGAMATVTTVIYGVIMADGRNALRKRRGFVCDMHAVDVESVEWERQVVA